MTDLVNPTGMPDQKAAQRRQAGLSRTSRTAALAGAAGAVFYAVGSLLPANPPRPGATAAQVVAFFAGRRDSLLTGIALEVVALGLFLGFLGELRRRIAEADTSSGGLSTAMTAAWVVLMTTVLVGTLPAVALVWQGAPAADPGLARMAYDMEILATYAASSTAAFVSIGAPSLVIWRSRILPRWLALLGLVAMALNVVELAGLASRRGALAGGYADGIGALVWVLWVAAASVCMAVSPDRQNGPESSPNASVKRTFSE